MRSVLDTVVGERGLSLVELLVAMAIGLIGTIIIFQVFSASEGVRRTTSAGGDAQQTGAIALYALEHDVRQSGMGFSDPTLVGCTVNAYDNQSSPTTPPPFPLVPVFITAGAASKDADTIAVLYGSKEVVANGVALSKDYSSPNMQSPINIANPWQFQLGDLIVLRAGAPNTANPCFLFEVTKVNPNNDLDHVPGGARFNPPGGFSSFGTLAYPMTSVVYDLGNYLAGNAIPVFNTYSISGNALQYTSAFSATPNAPLQVADNIVHMHARYVMSDGTFVTPPATPLWANLAAINLAVVARSRLPEKPSGGSTTCNTTYATPAPGNVPTWSGGTFDLSLDANWQCYRYRVFETTVPIRNWIWHN
jgi:type IV pilus assembly protein PilW